MSTPTILEWLSGIPYQSLPDHAGDTTITLPPRKRRRYSTLPPTPRSSKLSSSREPSPSKRMNTEDLTPGAPSKRKQSNRLGSSHSLSHATTTTESSARSGRLSPQKHLKALEAAVNGIEVRDLGRLEEPSSKLNQFLKDMRRVTRSRGILPLSERPYFQGSQRKDLAELGEDDAMFSADRYSIGHAPDASSVLRLLRLASECHENLHSEASWNTLVHSKVLDMAFHPPEAEPLSGFLSYFPCSSASIIPDYLPPISSSKKVDFCVFFNLASESCPGKTLGLETINDSLPENSINHTGYYPLRKRPIAFSIETKMTGQGWESAVLQLGVWQASYWNFLEAMKGFAKHDSPNFQHRMPEFLPSILIQGHTWHLVLTTRENARTRIWTDLKIGSTGDVEGIYQLIYALQRLAKWAREEFWPVLEGLLAGIAGPQPQAGS